VHWLTVKSGSFSSENPNAKSRALYKISANSLAMLANVFSSFSEIASARAFRRSTWAGDRARFERPALPLPRLPPISLRTRPTHQHRPLGLAQAIRRAERLNPLLVVDDGGRARPVGAPQAAIETQASNTRASGSRMSANGYGCFDRVQAPESLITAFLRRASSMAGLLRCLPPLH
jgi:hypothetical protein